MIKKERKIPIIIKKLEALIRRVPLSHPRLNDIKISLANNRSGYIGEQSLDYYYRYLPSSDYFLLHGLRIKEQDFYFQLDSLFITPHFLLILEVKNYAGELYFENEFKQLIRTSEGKEKAFPNPIHQVKRQAYHLSNILELHKLRGLPIESLVVMTNQNAIIKRAASYSEVPMKVVKSPEVANKFAEFMDKHKNVALQLKDMRKLSRLLLKLHKPSNPDVCKKYQVERSDLTKGVLCLICESFIMTYKKGIWCCIPCGASSKSAHLAALMDYALLISTTISNKKCKLFLNLPSHRATTHLLTKLNLPYTGETKSRVYDLNLLLE